MSHSREKTHPHESQINSNHDCEKDPHSLADGAAECAHAIADASTVSHMGGVHLPKPLHVVATIAEYVAEVIHHPTGDIAEKMVCGAGITLIKETINNAIATPAAVLAGTTTSITTSPVGGAIIAATVGMVVHDTTDKVITEPLSHLTRNLCHDTFENLQGEKHKSNNHAPIDTATKCSDVATQIQSSNRDQHSFFYVVDENHLCLIYKDGSYKKIGNQATTWQNVDAMTTVGNMLYIVQNNHLHAVDKEGNYQVLGKTVWKDTVAMTAMGNMLYIMQGNRLHAVDKEGHYQVLGKTVWKDTAAMTALGNTLYIMQGNRLHAVDKEGNYQVLGKTVWKETAAMTALGNTLYIMQGNRLHAVDKEGNYKVLGKTVWKNTAVMTVMGDTLYIMQGNRLHAVDKEGNYQVLGKAVWTNIQSYNAKTVVSANTARQTPVSNPPITTAPSKPIVVTIAPVKPAAVATSLKTQATNKAEQKAAKKTRTSAVISKSSPSKFMREMRRNHQLVINIGNNEQVESTKKFSTQLKAIDDKARRDLERRLREDTEKAKRMLDPLIKFHQRQSNLKGTSAIGLFGRSPAKNICPPGTSLSGDRKACLAIGIKFGGK